jgi:hypothetical protein
VPPEEFEGNAIEMLTRGAPDREADEIQPGETTKPNGLGRAEGDP